MSRLTLNKKIMLSAKLKKIKLSPIRKVANLLEHAKSRKDIISFGGGAPSLPPPKELMDELINLATLNPYELARYCGSQGIYSLREKISEDVKKYTGVEYDPEKEIIITEGSTEGIFLVLSVLLNENDEVILPDPTYLGYSEVINFLGGKIVRINQFETTNYQPSIEELKEKINKKTKAIILNTPENPTGKIINEKIGKEIVEIAKDNKIFVIVDEAYKHIVYDKKNTFLNTFDKDTVISVCSFSKEASLPGFRLGYVCANEEIISAMERIKQLTTLCSNMPAQLILIKYLASKLKDEYLSKLVIPTYKKRRDFMIKMINEYLNEASYNIPDGAFYIFLNIKKYIRHSLKNDEELTFDILNKHNVVVIPGSYFGNNGFGFIRLTFVSEEEDKIEEGIKRLSKYFNTVKW